MNAQIISNQQNSKISQFQKNLTLQAIKSQKNLSSLVNINKNQEQKFETSQNNHRKNIQTQKTQMRETWKKPRMPHSKLLEAFIPQKKKHLPKSLAKDVIKNIDMLIQNNQYKQVQKYLSPLIIEKKKQSQERKQKQDKNQSKNPLLPFKKYMKNAEKFNQELNKEIQDLTLDKLDKYKFVKTNFVVPNFKLEQFVTIDIIKRIQNTGTIKKMLHVPTLQLYTVKQQPISSKQSRNIIKEWITHWQTKVCVKGQPQGNSFVKIFSTFWNTPQGSVSILMQYCDGGSLQKLLQSVGTLPENIIKQIFTSLLRILNYYYLKTQIIFGGLSPSQILFTQKCEVKLSMGLFYRLNMNSTNIFNTRGNKISIFQTNNGNNLWTKWTPEKSVIGNNLELQKSFDILKLGLSMLMCALGSYEIYQQSEVIFETLKTIIITQQGQKSVQKQNICCLLHSEQILLKISLEDKGTKREKVDFSKTFKYISFLKNRYSTNFISFLCGCLKLSNKKRLRINDLLIHNFIVNPIDVKSIKVNLIDLLKISRGWYQQTPNLQLVQKNIERLFQQIMMVIPNCRRESLNQFRELQRHKLVKISQQLGVKVDVLLKFFDQLVSELQKKQQQ